MTQVLCSQAESHLDVVVELQNGLGNNLSQM